MLDRNSLTRLEACRQSLAWPTTERARGRPGEITFRLPEPASQACEALHAIDSDLDLQYVVREALEQFLARKGAR